MNRGISLAAVAAVALMAPSPVWGKKPAAPVNTSPPTISGSAVQGSALQGSSGTWSNSPTSYAYRWQRCNTGGGSCASISGATSSSYILTSADAGFTIRLVVSATNNAGTTSATSAATAVVKPLPPVNTTAPAISGSPVEGSTLTASTGSWTNNPTAYSYQWERCTGNTTCSAIGGATASTYVPGPADYANTLEVTVTASNAGGTSSPATSQATTAVTAPAGTPATAYQLNAGHTGATSDSFWTGAIKRWTVNLGARISYPLIVGNQVFVTAGDSTAGTNSLYALNADTGQVEWGPKPLGGSYWWSGLTYDGGRVFTVNGSGTMQAWDAGTGALDWSTALPGQYSFSSPPTASGGLVYTGGAGSGGTLYAVSESSGSVVWTAPVENGDNSSPAVSSSGVYVSYACGQTYDFDPSTGAQTWHVNTACEGGGGKTPVLANGDLYVRDSQFPGVFDAATGNLLSSFASSGPAPAVTSSAVYDLQSGTLSASGAAPGSSTNWTFSGDGTLSSAPLVAGNLVFVAGSSGNVYALSTSTGAVVWSANAGSGVLAPDEQNVSQPLTGLASSGGLLVVPAGDTLVAFR